MIVWINGAFGAGKTQAAFELVRRAADTVLCDPEVIGYGLQRFLPKQVRPDFQSLPLWRAAVVDGLVRTYGRFPSIVVPMTLVEPNYRAEIFDGLRAAGLEVREFVLDASAATLRRRLSRRIAAIPLRDTWALAQIDRCLAGLAEVDAVRVDTDRLSHDEVVERIAAIAGIDLAVPRRGPVGRRLQTLANSARVIRW